MVALEAIVLPAEGRQQNPEALALSEDDTRLLAEAIRQLDGERQELLVLKFTEGLTNAEIGAIMGRSEGAIKSLYHRTLLALRRDLSRKGYDQE